MKITNESRNKIIIEEGDNIFTAEGVLEVVAMTKNRQQVYCKNDDEEIIEIDRSDLNPQVFADV
tara:strand:- start:2031 stop:2222 length:192 start_codon:yes stop_codon:yes gene_type:complete